MYQLVVHKIFSRSSYRPKRIQSHVIPFTDMKTVGVQKGIGQSFDPNIARVSKNSKGGVDDYSIRTQASWSHGWLQIETWPN